jgi:hypothetical protein
MLESLLTNLSGTSPEQHDRFFEQVERQHSRWKLFFLKRSLCAQLLRPEDFRQFPYFVYEPESPRELARRLLFPLAALAFLTALIAAVALMLIGVHPIRAWIRSAG